MQEGLFASVGTGGPIVVILLVLSLISLTLIAVKWLQLRSAVSGAVLRDTAFNQWQSGSKSEASATLTSGKSPADRILRHAMEGLLAGVKRPALESDLTWRGNTEVSDMTRHIRLLELIAMISPLLGLLGTVLGMIQSFQELELAQGAANASVLAGGIWQALLTTAAGLIVAIPAAVGATLLSARIERSGQLIETSVGQLFSIEDTK